MVSFVNFVTLATFTKLAAATLSPASTSLHSNSSCLQLLSQCDNVKCIWGAQAQHIFADDASTALHSNGCAASAWHAETPLKQPLPTGWEAAPTASCKTPTSAHTKQLATSCAAPSARHNSVEHTQLQQSAHKCPPHHFFSRHGCIRQPKTDIPTSPWQTRPASVQSAHARSRTLTPTNATNEKGPVALQPTVAKSPCSCIAPNTVYTSQ